jgi:DNA-binding SARP family transcriptional activator
VQVGVRLLGGLSVAVDGVPVEPGTWKSRRAAQLVALLAMAPSRRLATEQVMDLLWPELAPEAARANLHKAATLARRAMGWKESVVIRGDLVTLWPTGDVAVDVVEFEQDARRALASSDRQTCAEVAGRYGGELLPEERYEDWSHDARERARRLYLDLLRTGGLWSALAEAEPTDEAAHRGLMVEHFRAGRLHAAIRQFQRLRTILARDLGVLPSSQTVALYREIVGTATSGWVRPGLVGREIELVRARGTLRRAAEGRPAAVFVTGPAGIGKTRLCEELVEQATGEGWFVLRGTGREQTASVPYWPLVEAVQAALVERPDVAESLGEPEQTLPRGSPAWSPTIPGARCIATPCCTSSPGCWRGLRRPGRCCSSTTFSRLTRTRSPWPRCCPARRCRGASSSWLRTVTVATSARPPRHGRWSLAASGSRSPSAP